MKWYLTKLVYQIICGTGAHTPQFDEQLRLIRAGSELEALDKAVAIGRNEEDSFCNTKNEWVRWKFINVSELLRFNQLIDGAELYSRIQEIDDASNYLHAVHQKAAALRERTNNEQFQLI